ncbi:MAG: ABC transporter ATP-binding protein [Pseudomonadota bacterium]
MLELEKLEHSYGGEPVLRQLSMQLDTGHIGCILGASGCGKTTLLRAIAGFESLQSGSITLNQKLISSSDTHLAPAQRGVGMIFQDYALLPHLTVAQNIEFGLQTNASEKSKRLAQMLELVGLAAEQERFPHELSGGQQQRVAIARALAPRPSLILMDEPFSNLDASLRGRLGREVRDLLRAAGATVLMVTHDHHDALALADDVGVMAAGELLQWSSAYDLYHRPASRTVAEAVGRSAWLPGRVLESGWIETELGTAKGLNRVEYPVGTAVDLLLRPDDLVHIDASQVQAEVLRRHFHGASFLYELRLASGRVVFSTVPSHHDHKVGERIGVELQADHLVAFAQA